MPMPKSRHKTVRREIMLPLPIAATLETIFFDPMTGKARYGAVNTYIISLINADLARRGLSPGAAKIPLDNSDGSADNTGTLGNNQEQQP